MKKKEKFSLKKIKKSKNKITSTEEVQNKKTLIKITKTVGFYGITDKVLGHGHRSIVYLGFHEISRKKIAVKFFAKEFVDHYGDIIEREVQILNAYKKSTVVINLENSFMDGTGNYYLIFELADCTLETLVKDVGKKLTEKHVLYMTIQMLKGIYALHEKNISHGDIKLENILVFKSYKKSDDAMNVTLKVGDLGFGSYCDEKTLLNRYSGSPLYAAPEITLFKPYNGLKSDIWSFGILIYFMIYGRFPYDIDEDEDVSSLFSKIQTESFSLEHEDRVISDDFKHLIPLLLCKDPGCRISCKQMINHPWIVSSFYVN